MTAVLYATIGFMVLSIIITVVILGVLCYRLFHDDVVDMGVDNENQPW